MAFSDVMQSLGRFIGLYSDTDAYDDQQAYDTYEQPEESYVPAEEETNYQSGYGVGGSYVRAGAKPAPVRRPAEEPASGLFGRGRQPKQQPPQQPYYQPDNVVRMPDRDERIAPVQPVQQQSSMIIYCVRRKDDSSEIINYLIQGTNVILNFEEVDDAQCQRVLDMVSGAAFALRGSVERISHRNYLVAPTGAQVVRSEQQGRESRDMRDGGYVRDSRDGGYVREVRDGGYVAGDGGYAVRY